MVTNQDSYTFKTGIVFPWWLLAFPGLSHAAKIIYAIIHDAARGKCGTAISLTELAANIGDTEEEVAEYLRELEGCGLIGKEKPCLDSTASSKESVHQKPSEGKLTGERVQRRTPRSRYSFQTCFAFAQKIKESGEAIRNVGGFAGHLYWTGTQDEEIALMLLSREAPDPRDEKATNVLCYRRN